MFFTAVRFGRAAICAGSGWEINTMIRIQTLSPPRKWNLSPSPCALVTIVFPKARKVKAQLLAGDLRRAKVQKNP